MHRVLKALYELLQVADPGVERTQLIGRLIGRGARRRLIGGGCAADLPDPRDQSLTFGHVSPPAGSLRRRGTRRVPSTFLGGHLADNQRTACNLLADEFKLRLALFLGFLACRLHPITSRRRAAVANMSGKRDLRLSFTSPVPGSTI